MPTNIWVIAYINSKFVDRIGRDIRNLNLNYGWGIDYSVPMVRVLSKKFKGTKFFREIPLLFNYGFINMPFNIACDYESLIIIKNEVNAIHGWLYKKEEEWETLDSEGMLTDDMKVYEVSAQIVKRLNNVAKRRSVYHAHDVAKLHLGDLVVLKGYPFDGIKAEIIEINVKKEEAKVKLFMGENEKLVKVGFGNLFYTIYDDYFGMNLDSQKFVELNPEIYESN